jgi:diaminopimelate epimerase
LDGADPADLARWVSRVPPHGIGADGLILYGPSRTADVCMTVYNADGSRAAMCGNGIRALGKWVLESDPNAGTTLAYEANLPGAARRQRTVGIAHPTWLPEELGDLRSSFARVLAWTGAPESAACSVRRLTVETDSGIKVITALLAGNVVLAAAVDVGIATLDLTGLGPARPRTNEARLVDEPVVVAGTTFALTCVDVGNLHAVVFVPDVDAIALEDVGPAIERHVLFPDRVNVHFVAVKSRTRLIMRPWERGSGATAACGTGACAAVTAAVARRKGVRLNSPERPFGCVAQIQPDTLSAVDRSNLEAEVAQPGGSVCVRLDPVAAYAWRAHLIGTAELVETGTWPG